MKKAVLALATAATIGVTALVTASPAYAWRGGWGGGWGGGLAGGLIAGAVIGGIASSAYAYGPGYGYYGGPGYYGGYAPAYYGGYAPAYGYGYAQRIAMDTLPHTTADMGIDVWFAPHMHTVADIIAGIGPVGNREGALLQR